MNLDIQLFLLHLNMFVVHQWQNQLLYKIMFLDNIELLQSVNQNNQQFLLDILQEHIHQFLLNLYVYWWMYWKWINYIIYIYIIYIHWHEPRQSLPPWSGSQPSFGISIHCWPLEGHCNPCIPPQHSPCWQLFSSSNTSIS